MPRRAPCTRGLCASCTRKMEHTKISQRRHPPAFPARWFDGFTVSFELSPGNGVLPRRLANEFTKLDASTGAVGHTTSPYAISVARQSPAFASTDSTREFVTCATPSRRVRRGI